MNLWGMLENGLLSPTLSSRGGEGEDPAVSALRGTNRGFSAGRGISSHRAGVRGESAWRLTRLSKLRCALQFLRFRVLSVLGGEMKKL
jgi:hypothetical protein